MSHRQSNRLLHAATEASAGQQVIPVVDLTNSDAELHLLFTVTNLNSRTVKAMFTLL